MLAEELRKMREAIQFLRADAKKQQEFNQALVEKLDKQQTYIDSKDDGDLIHIGEGNANETANGAVEVMSSWRIGLKNYVLKK